MSLLDQSGIAEQHISDTNYTAIETAKQLALISTTEKVTLQIGQIPQTFLKRRSVT